MSEFDIVKYAEKSRDKCEDIRGSGDIEEFYTLCDVIRNIVDDREGREKIKDQALIRQNKALLGSSTEVSYYINKIRQILEEKRLSASRFPTWYKDLPEAVYQESYGYAGIADWMDNEGRFKESVTCKIIGKRIYYDVDGVLKLQKQTISKDRMMKLRSTLLCADPRQIKSEAYHEIYAADGKRITIYNDSGMMKEGQPAIVFRRYLNNVSSFEAQAQRGTIPKEVIPMFKDMVKCGYNVAFTGPVKSAKTTFMTAWQSCEDDSLEGLQIETDPEIPLHSIMPRAPIMQMVPTGKYMEQVITTAKRSDAQYVILGEARNGEMMNIAVEAANMGTRHSKVTLHTSETVDFSFDVADKITRACGGDLGCNMIKVAKSFQYIFSFFSLPSDRKQKRLKELWEMRYDNEQMKITMHLICRYRVLTDDWVFTYEVGGDKRKIGIEENSRAFYQFDEHLKDLAEQFPDGEKTVCEPAFLKLWRRA